MKCIVLALLLVSSAAVADPSAQANEARSGPSTIGTAPPDNPRPNGNVAQGNILPNVAKMAAVPSELLSAPQYQPQPFQTSGPSPLYSMSPP